MRDLSKRERDVLDLVIEGHSDKAISTKLGISQSAVKGRMANILLRLRAKNRTQAAVIYVRSQGAEEPQQDGPRIRCGGVTG